MNLKYRLKSRIKNEGFCRTLEYLVCVLCYCFRECLYNTILDLHYSKHLLRGNIKSRLREFGANDIYHTKYSALPLIFRFVRITKDDVLVDVGCGKGRVINYWLCRKFKNKIIGLELDETIAKQTAHHFSNRKNVTIIQGNAIENIPKDATVFYFYNPFSRDIVQQFEAKLSEMFQQKPITIIYYNPKSIDVFQNLNWRIRYINFERDLGKVRWGRINKYHDLAIIKNRIHI